MKMQTIEQRSQGSPWRAVWALSLCAAILAVGGCMTPSANTFSRNFMLRPDVPVDPPPCQPGTHCDDCAVGGHLYKLYCGSCHNARPLGERPFSNYEVAISHMRDQAYLTGKEYRQIIHFIRRWHDVGPASPPTTPSPKRFFFSQPIAELKPDSPAPVPPPGDSASPWQNAPAQAGPPAQAAPPPALSPIN